MSTFGPKLNIDLIIAYHVFETTPWLLQTRVKIYLIEYVYFHESEGKSSFRNNFNHFMFSWGTTNGCSSLRNIYLIVLKQFWLDLFLNRTYLKTTYIHMLNLVMHVQIAEALSFWTRCHIVYHIEKSASAGAIVKKSRCVRKCVRNNYQGAGVRAPHTKISRNPTSESKSLTVNN